MRLILKHELTHCKRKDLWFKGLLLWARALHFFNPFVHWMAHLAEKDMELSCDLVVMADCGMAEREAYSMGNPADSARGEKQKYADEYGFFGRKGGIEDAV